MNFPRLTLTNAAIAAIGNAVFDGENADPIIFTCVRIGSQQWSGDIRTATQVQAVEMTAGFDAVAVSDGIAHLSFLLSNADLDNGFYIREIGVFAKVSEEGTEFLYAYSNTGSSASYIAPYDNDTSVSMTVTLHVAIGDAEHVTAVISEATGYVLQDAFDEHLQDYDNPHQVTAEQVGLGNVPNLAPSDMEINFTVSPTFAQFSSGDKLSVILGKAAKLWSIVRNHIITANNPHNVTYEQAGAAPEVHTHVLADITDWPGSATVEETRGYLESVYPGNKDKIVTLEDLREALKRMTLWEDITNQLTWGGGLYIGTKRTSPYNKAISSQFNDFFAEYSTSSAAKIAGITQNALLEAAPRERYRITKYWAGNHSLAALSRFPVTGNGEDNDCVVTTWDIADDVTTGGFSEYKSIEITVPEGVTHLAIFDMYAEGSVIVEKAAQ